MAYFIPTNDPDFILPERYRSKEKKTKPIRQQLPPPTTTTNEEPEYKVGDLVMFNGGIHKIYSIKPRYVKHGKSKGKWLYGIGAGQPTTAIHFKPVTTDILNSFRLTPKIKHYGTN